jgi:spore coat polysaccharide biosynthesis protein SpsF
MLADLGGRPIIQWVVERLKRSKLINNIVIATPDKELIDVATSLNCWGYLDTGDPNNVLSRYIKASNWSGGEIVVRICGDSPLIDPEIVDNCIKGYLNNRVDISTNVLRRTFIKGMDVEVFHNSVLKRIQHLTNNPNYREHVTLMAYDMPHLFVFHSLMDSNDNSRFNCSIDTQRDLDRMDKLVSSVNVLSYSDIVNWFIQEGY